MLGSDQAIEVDELEAADDYGSCRRQYRCSELIYSSGRREIKDVAQNLLRDPNLMTRAVNDVGLLGRVDVSQFLRW
jgi:hypothetical protein